MQRPLKSPLRRREIYVKNRDSSLCFVMGLSISATIILAYYSRFINL